MLHKLKPVKFPISIYSYTLISLLWILVCYIQEAVAYIAKPGTTRALAQASAYLALALKS